MAAKLKILLLSDLHAENRESDKCLNSLKKEIIENRTIDLDYIFINGDISNKATEKGFGTTQKFLNDLILDSPGVDLSRLIINSGNHDINRDGFKDPKIYNRILKAGIPELDNILSEKGIDFITTNSKNEKVIKHINFSRFKSPYGRFLKFLDSLEKTNDKIKEITDSGNFQFFENSVITGESRKFDWVKRICGYSVRNIGAGNRLIINVVNSAWFSPFVEKSGWGHVLGQGLIEYNAESIAALRNEKTIVLTLIHHWAEDLDWSQSYPGEYHSQSALDTLANISDIIVSGHVHTTIPKAADIYQCKTLHFTLGSTFGGTDQRKTFKILEVDFENRTVHNRDFLGSAGSSSPGVSYSWREIKPGDAKFVRDHYNIPDQFEFDREMDFWETEEELYRTFKSKGSIEDAAIFLVKIILNDYGLGSFKDNLFSILTVGNSNSFKVYSYFIEELKVRIFPFRISGREQFSNYFESLASEFEKSILVPFQIIRKDRREELNDFINHNVDSARGCQIELSKTGMKVLSVAPHFLTWSEIKDQKYNKYARKFVCSLAA